jgi:hypothetical protein
MPAEEDRVVSSALAYASYGWPVFPCHAGSKVPATLHGFRDATTDPEQIREWWHRQPDANVAIATGSPGPDVLDIDQHGEAGDGFGALNQLVRAGLITQARAVIGTPSGGLHAYFTGSSQPTRRLPRHHLDFRAQGGYVVAPPSRIGGRFYQVLGRSSQSHGLDWRRAAELLEPGRDPSPVRAVTSSPRDASHLAAWLATQGPDSHNRNDGLFWTACRAVEIGDENVLADLAATARVIGLGDREIERTIASARRTARRPAVAGPGAREAAT